MRDFKTTAICFLLSCLTFAFSITTRAQSSSEKHNVFGAVKCDKEMAILDGIEKLQTGQEESKEREKEILHIVRQLQAKEQQGIPQIFVTLPNLTDKVYGRKEEINALLEHLRTDNRHAAIVVPTCFGKTYLIKKFLYKTLDENSVKAGHSNIFTKVIYLVNFKLGDPA